MFHWPSWTSLLTRPVDQAEDSADQFADVLKQLKEFKELHADVLGNKKISLLAHSMGHIVIQEFTEHYYDHDLNAKDGKPLFDSFVSAGGDVPMNDHRQWFEKLDYVGKRFVMMNDNDIILIMSYFLDLRIKKPYDYKLGLGFLRFPMRKQDVKRFLDPNTTYIDVSKVVASDHYYYEGKKQLMQKLFMPLLKGQDFHPEIHGAKFKKEENVYYMRD